MSREDIVKVVIWTMEYYGSDAQERAEPGSKLRSQAHHIADVLEQYNEACARVSTLEYVQVVVSGHTI